MVEVWGSVLTLIGNAFTVCIDFILFDAFATRKKVEEPIGALLL